MHVRKKREVVENLEQLLKLDSAEDNRVTSTLKIHNDTRIITTMGRYLRECVVRTLRDHYKATEAVCPASHGSIECAE